MGNAGEVGRELAKTEADTKAKAEADAKAKGETKEEETTETETTEEKKAAEETEEEQTTEETEEEDPNALSVSQRVQDRIDALTERMIAKDKRIAELEARQPRAETAEPKVTLEQLDVILNDPLQAEWHPWARKKERDLIIEEAEKKSEMKAQVFNAQKSSYERAKAEFPDMADTTSELWAKANEIYIKKNYQNDPDGQYMAALLAAKELGVQGETKTDITTSKKADKEITKKSLATVSKKSITTRADELAKLEKAANESGKFGTPAWNKYLLELEKDRRAKRKQ